jgi:hypothetical protein
MTDYVVCAFCFARGVFKVPATQTVRTSTGINTACSPCADEVYDAREAHWELLASRMEDA